MSDTELLEVSAYQHASHALLALIRGEHAASRTPEERQARAGAKLARTRRLLAALGNPHMRFSSVHVTGTSGKGSTSAAIAAVLNAAGYRAGLRTSPYLQVMTEKLQIGPSLIDAPSFARVVDRVLKVGREIFPTFEPGQRLGYAEVWTAASFLWFAERGVDIAVVEVGAGGRFDATNVLTPLVSVITSVGLDHVVSLGPTLADIAWHKAGIIKNGSPVVVGELPDAAERVVTEIARAMGSDILRPTLSIPNQFPDMPDFHKRNSAIATATVSALRGSGFAVSEEAVLAGLTAPWLPGRLERMPTSSRPDVWIDGAHNPDKIDALVREWPSISVNGRSLVVVVGLLGSKDASAILARLTAGARAIVATAPQVHGKRSHPAEDLAWAVRALGFKGPTVVEPEPSAALRHAIAIATELDGDVLATGSLYLAGELRRLWYPNDDVVLARTPWPSVGRPGQELRLRSVAR